MAGILAIQVHIQTLCLVMTVFSCLVFAMDTISNPRSFEGKGFAYRTRATIGRS
jgi:hypothetical protein